MGGNGKFGLAPYGCPSWLAEMGGCWEGGPPAPYVVIHGDGMPLGNGGLNGDGFGVNYPPCPDGQVRQGVQCVDVANATLNISLLPAPIETVINYNGNAQDWLTKAKAFATSNPLIAYGGLGLVVYLLFIKK